ncbi:MAG TPA: M42 family metallopeptidase [Clostridiales bacterium]|nr:M42 family metallopeptidase [Clostridiales bacterium]
MISKIDKYLEDLVLLPGLSGHEQRISAYMGRVFEEHGFYVQEDVHGNCIASLPDQDSALPCLMVFAHMDSLGFFIRHIDDRGFIRVERLGGIPEKVLPSTKVAIVSRDGNLIPGVFGIKQHHVTPPEEKYVVDKVTNLYIDIGATNRDQVKALGIDIGSPVVYAPYYQKLAGTRRLGTTMDNRSGCAALLILAKMLSKSPPPQRVVLVGTVWEEFNLRGAMMAARTVKPTWSIGIDGGAAGDTPDFNDYNSVTLGGGPILTLYNFHGRGTLNGMIPHPAMVRLMETAAEDAGIIFQRNAVVGGLTDASYLQLEGKGIPSVDVGIPRRYSHSPSEALDLCDVETLCRWVYAACQTDLTAFDFSRSF